MSKLSDSGAARAGARSEARNPPCVNSRPGEAHASRPTQRRGPRSPWLCATCQRALKAAQRAQRHEVGVRARYGLSEGAYGALKAAQGGRCAICRRATGRRKRLAVDHNHRTGEVRGLLCGPCNLLLGRFQDSPELLMNAVEYLLRPPARPVLLRLIGTD